MAFGPRYSWPPFKRVKSRRDGGTEDGGSESGGKGGTRVVGNGATETSLTGLLESIREKAAFRFMFGQSHPPTAPPPPPSTLVVINDVVIVLVAVVVVVVDVVEVSMGDPD